MKLPVILISNNPLSGRCPRCEREHSLHRARIKSSLMKSFSFLSLRRLYRCRYCSWKGYLFTFYLSEKHLNELFVYSGVSLLGCLMLLVILNGL